MSDEAGGGGGGETGGEAGGGGEADISSDQPPEPQETPPQEQPSEETTPETEDQPPLEDQTPGTTPEHQQEPVPEDEQPPATQEPEADPAIQQEREDVASQREHDVTSTTQTEAATESEASEQTVEPAETEPSEHTNHDQESRDLNQTEANTRPGGDEQESDDGDHLAAEDNDTAESAEEQYEQDPETAEDDSEGVDEDVAQQDADEDDEANEDDPVLDQTDEVVVDRDESPNRVEDDSQSHPFDLGGELIDPNEQSAETLEPLDVSRFNPTDKSDSHINAYKDQLKEQEKAINAMTAEEWVDARKAFNERKELTGSGRNPDADILQRELRQDYESDRLQRRQEQLLVENMQHEPSEQMTYDQILEQAQTEVSEEMEKLAALHEPDMIAGGYFKPYPARMGDSGVNSSIGSSWPSRVSAIDDYAEEAVRSGNGSRNMNVKLTV